MQERLLRAGNMNDDSHLNYNGSTLFTGYLANILTQTYDLPDHRGDAYFESWERHIQEIKEQKKD